MTVLLSYSTSWCQNNDTIPSTGGVNSTDTLVSIPIDYIRIANSKMIELNYEKEINNKLRQIVHNDSLVIDGVTYELNNCLRNCDDKIKRIKRERNIFICTSVVAAITTILLIISIL